ncbi:hypothetical protein [Desulfopila sp. IMCC35008]|uniref:hypothetical protein n=1 Tax=Desulfopila sp. IMCC35008 TaxID=2653858 RepID=UPI0013D7F5DF|nr:hypothetical protein [Desulfopila sp. IMCC35008]
MNHIRFRDVEVFLPMPVFPIIEDVGWWQGEDGSAMQQPYRNAFSRRHCLADYQALARFADSLGVRIGLGMVLCEWDRKKVLRDIPGATWLGREWNNHINQGPWLDETAEYLQDKRDLLELGLHGLCHEFWYEGGMERSEFHDRNGVMRSPQVIQDHLDAFGRILEHNGFSEFPRLFFPPALNHSFGNGPQSIQAILHNKGIRHVITRFAKAKRFASPRHEKISWECGVGLLERGQAPVPWNVPASLPSWDFSGPILPLHWGNLLHPDPEHNNDIIDGWTAMLLARTVGPELILAENFDACWRQAAVFYFGQLFIEGQSIVVDLRARPVSMPYYSGPFYLKIRAAQHGPLDIEGAQIISDHLDGARIRTVQLLPKEGVERVRLLLPWERNRENGVEYQR